MTDRPRPAWSWPELVAAFLLGYAAPGLAHHLLAAGGFYAALYGPERVAALEPNAPDATRFTLWAVAVAFPLQVAAALGLVWHTSRATPADVGLHARRPGFQLGLASGLAVPLVPLVYGVNALALLVTARLGLPDRPHVFTRLFQAGVSTAEMELLAFAAVVAAPVWEELLFRGLLQPWVTANEEAGELAALGVGAAIAFASGAAPGVAALPFAAACPLLPRAWRGVYATAFLFAFVHSAAWPSPVPLLLLGVGLGWLARSGGGLLGPIALHALFNAVSCVVLLVAPPG